MKILTDKKISDIKNEVITKMYNALVRLDQIKEQEYNPNSETIRCHNHAQILDIALKYFYAKPTGERKYDWSKSADLSNFIE